MVDRICNYALDALGLVVIGTVVSVLIAVNYALWRWMLGS